eukprot:TRINITY_DN33939_c0_g1_i1.p1 TRINITY_DN33939_c0_g1~~TRINITY_DN33939_c0_g1_i1.p1  ORF type:complete len:258 (+),score=75.22 TRINITY_DN33939_c0_g1_i1:102-875(+)
MAAGGDLEALRRQLQAHDDLLQTLLRPGAADVGRAQETLAAMEQALGTLRQLVARDPSAASVAEDFRRRHAKHAAALQAQREQASRGKLLGDAAEKNGKKSAKEMSKEENDKAELNALTKARDRMKGGLDQMVDTMNNLDGSSKRIAQTQDQYREYAAKLDSAAKVLGHLKKKTEEDSRYIWGSFIFFMSVVAFIVLRRLKVFKIIYYTVTVTLWTGSTTGSVIQSVLEQLRDAFDTVWLQSGLPAVVEVKVDGLSQ